jgi:hypothetical protein
LSGRLSHRGQAALIGGANLFAVAPDGQRFLFAAPQYLAPETITLVVNWAEELTRRD